MCDASGRREKKNSIQSRSRNESLNASNRFLIQHPNERISEFLFYFSSSPHFLNHEFLRVFQLKMFRSRFLFPPTWMDQRRGFFFYFSFHCTISLVRFFFSVIKSKHFSFSHILVVAGGFFSSSLNLSVSYFHDDIKYMRI